MGTKHNSIESQIAVFTLLLALIALLLTPGCAEKGEIVRVENESSIEDSLLITDDSSDANPRYFEATVGGEVIGTEKIIFEVSDSRFEPGRLICDVTRKTESEQVHIIYIYESTSSLEEYFGVKQYSDFKKILVDEYELELHMRINFGGKECPMFELSVAGLVQGLCSATFDLGQGEKTHAMIPSYGEKRIEVMKTTPTVEGYNIGLLVLPENIEIFALVDPEAGAIVRLGVPSMDLEIYEVEEPGGGKSVNYYFMMAYIYSGDQAYYDKALEYAREAQKLAPGSDKVKWLLEEIEGEQR